MIRQTQARPWGDVAGDGAAAADGAPKPRFASNGRTLSSGASDAEGASADAGADDAQSASPPSQKASARGKARKLQSDASALVEKDEQAAPTPAPPSLLETIKGLLLGELPEWSCLFFPLAHGT